MLGSAALEFPNRQKRICCDVVRAEGGGEVGPNLVKNAEAARCTAEMTGPAMDGDDCNSLHCRGLGGPDGKLKQWLSLIGVNLPFLLVNS